MLEIRGLHHWHMFGMVNVHSITYLTRVQFIQKILKQILRFDLVYFILTKYLGMLFEYKDLVLRKLSAQMQY